VRCRAAAAAAGLWGGGGGARWGRALCLLARWSPRLPTPTPKRSPSHAGQTPILPIGADNAHTAPPALQAAMARRAAAW